MGWGVAAQARRIARAHPRPQRDARAPRPPGRARALPRRSRTRVRRLNPHVSVAAARGAPCVPGQPPQDPRPVRRASGAQSARSQRALQPVTQHPPGRARRGQASAGHGCLEASTAWRQAGREDSREDSIPRNPCRINESRGDLPVSRRLLRRFSSSPGASGDSARVRKSDSHDRHPGRAAQRLVERVGLSLIHI